MIPTRFKAKLSKLLTYPIGAEALSEGLADVPQLDALSIWFHDGRWPAVGFQAVLRKGSPYPIVGVNFSPARGQGYYTPKNNDGVEERWSLDVYPVLREYRYAANQLLKTQGLGSLATWLRSFPEITNNTPYRGYELIFHPAENTLIPKEHSRLHH